MANTTPLHLPNLNIDPETLTPAKIENLHELIEELSEAATEAVDQIDVVDDAAERLKEATDPDDRQSLREDRDSEREDLANKLEELQLAISGTLDALHHKGLAA